MPSIFHGNELHAIAPEAVAAALSLIGDCLLIGTFAMSNNVRKVVALRLIVPLAVANLFGCIFFFVLILGDEAVDKDPVLCAATTAGAATTGAPEADALGSMASECARILACSEHAPPLEVLGWSAAQAKPPPGIDVVRRRFRQLAMRLHPDKCDLPDAEEAMKRVNKAFAMLDA